LSLFSLEKSLVYYLSAINSNGVLVERLRNASSKLGFNPEDLEFLDDILVENNQCRGQTDIYSQVLASMMDARASIISNNLNVRIKALTIITIVIMLPTLVVSIFSMNVHIPMQLNPHAFWIIMGMSAACAAVVGILWRKQRW
jgi:magnesium transporter